MTSVIIPSHGSRNFSLFVKLPQKVLFISLLLIWLCLCAKGVRRIRVSSELYSQVFRETSMIALARTKSKASNLARPRCLFL
jgi:hypothetical protein